MSGVPERIWAWYFHADQQNDVMQGGWRETVDHRETAYIRADISEAAKAAARAEGERIGMERAAGMAAEKAKAIYVEADDEEIPEWAQTQMRANANTLDFFAYAIRAAMDAKPPQPEYPSDADIERSLRTAGLLPDFLKPVDRP